MNHSNARRKGEPKRRRHVAGHVSRIVEPGTKSGTPLVPVESVASLLLVILHYLLKNNRTFMDWNVQVKMSPGVPSTPQFRPGGI